MKALPTLPQNSRVMLAIREKNFKKLPFAQQHLLEVSSSSMRRVGAGILAIVIEADLLPKLAIDWDSLQLTVEKPN